VGLNLAWVETFEARDVLPGPGDLVRYLKTGPSLRSELPALIDSAAEIFADHATPMGVFSLVDVPSGSRELSRMAQIPFRSPLFTGATKLAFLVATLGPRPEARISGFFSGGDYLAGWILEAYSLAALDSVVKKLTAAIQGQAGPELQVGNVLNPGCHGLPLSTQKIIFADDFGAAIGVRLNESQLMLPVKSTSGILPLGRELAYPAGSDTCRFCNRRRDCVYRHTG